MSTANPPPPRPLFSIVIANYNYGRFLESAIQSVLRQIEEVKGEVLESKPKVEERIDSLVELIVIDGGSSDNSVDVIKKYANGLPPGIRRDDPSIVHLCPSLSSLAYWLSEKDNGQSNAFNKGFAQAKGIFMTWLNADDILMSGSLKAIKQEIERHPRCEWFTGSSVWTDEDLKIRRCFCAHKFSILRARYSFLSGNGPSTFFTKRLLDAVGGVDETLHYMMDTDLWNKFYHQCGVKYRRTRALIWAYRQHEASKMSGADKHTTVIALENRKKSEKESKILVKRYGLHSVIVRRLANLLSFSWSDLLVAKYRNFTLNGRNANEI